MFWRGFPKWRISYHQIYLSRDTEVLVWPQRMVNESCQKNREKMDFVSYLEIEIIYNDENKDTKISDFDFTDVKITMNRRFLQPHFRESDLFQLNFSSSNRSPQKSTRRVVKYRIKVEVVAKPSKNSLEYINSLKEIVPAIYWSNCGLQWNLKWLTFTHFGLSFQFSTLILPNIHQLTRISQMCSGSFYPLVLHKSPLQARAKQLIPTDIVTFEEFQCNTSTKLGTWNLTIS